MIIKTLTATLSAFLTLVSTQAEVTHWRVIKGVDYLQSADNTPDATSTNWHLFSIVETAGSNDAASVVMTGGNIAGSMAFIYEEGEWELGADYTSKAALDAVFPSSASYSIILSGGTLGSVTQDFSFAADAYPNTPYLTGADYSDCLALEALEPFEFNWNDAGTTTTVSLELNTGNELDEGDSLFQIYSNNFTSIDLPWNLFAANSNYNGYLDFANATNFDNFGGFSTNGDVSFNTSLAFHIDTVNTAVDYDDFNGGTNSSWISFLTEAGKQFTPTNDVFEFTTGTGPDGDSVAWIYDTDALSYTQDWSVALNIANFIDTSAITSGQDAYFSLLVGSDDLEYLMYLENFIEESYSEVFAGVDTNGVEDIVNAGVEIDAQQMALKISFDARRELLTSAYSLGGDYIVVTNFSTADWGFSDTNAFLAVLSCGSESLEISDGEVSIDNFRVYGEPAISNEVSLVELEYLRAFGTTLSTNDDFNEYLIEMETGHRVSAASFTLPDGEVIPLSNVNEDGATRSWEFEGVDDITEPFDTALDGVWTCTVGFIDGTFQSTLIPYTKEDGVTAIPVMTNQPLFTAININGNIVDFEWAHIDPLANHVAIDRWVEEEDDTEDVGLYADSITDEIGAVETIDGPLSTLVAGPYTAPSGTNEFLLLNGWGRTAYNDDGVPYIVAKLSESSYYIFIPSANDLDMDNMDDDWEIAYFGGTNVLDGGALDDFDEDGMLNIEEFIAGVNPTNDGSFFVVEEPGPSPSGFVVNWNSVAGREYAVYWAKTLTNTFENVTPGYLPYPINSYTDTVHNVEGCGFYFIDVQLDD